MCVPPGGGRADHLLKSPPAGGSPTELRRLIKNQNLIINLVRRTGFEPVTICLKGNCSTN